MYPNQPAEVYPDRTAQQRNTRTRQPFLTELYPGTTPLPDEPQFKDRTKVLGKMALRNGSFINRVSYDRRFTGNPKDSTKVVMRPDIDKNRPSVALQLSGSTVPYHSTSAEIWKRVTGDVALQLSGSTVPYHSTSAEIWKRVTGDNVPTNKEIINMQAGDPGYFDKAVQHYTNVPGADYARAGLWRFPVAQMRAYGNKTALVPELKNANENNGWWSSGKNAITIVSNPPSRSVEDLADAGGVYYGDDDYRAADIAAVPWSDAGLGETYSHEFNHSMSSPALNPNTYTEKVNHEPAFVISPESDYGFRWSTVPASGFVSPMYDATGTESTDYADRYGMVHAQKASADANIKPPNHAPQTPAVGMAADYPGFVRPGAIPANPVFRRAPVLYDGETYTGNRNPAGYYAYAYNHNEMTQGLISLNRAQHLLQQNIKKNPQAYIDAGVDPAALEQFMQMPTFLKSPAQLDQRMEFYHNHPEFSVLLGQEPARIIPRYFMLERERRNGDQSQEWRDYHQDLFNFTRANYFMARNGSQRQNPMHTGMGKLYNNLA